MNKMMARGAATALETGTSSAGARLMRVMLLVLMSVLVLPALFGATSAFADEGDEDSSDYSLYKMGSNTARFFDQENSPDGKGHLAENWGEITDSAADGGSLLGYADPELSDGDVVGWAITEISGSSSGLSYDTFLDPSGANEDANYSGMLDYSQFGAANKSLGLDAMSGGGGAGMMMRPITGGIIWILYALSMGVNMIFWVVIQILQALNPFGWFYTGLMSAGDGSASSIAQQKEMALGMVGGEPRGTGGLLGSIQIWVGTWYNLLMDMAWQLTVPLFIALLIFTLVLNKRANRGSLVKKFVVRLLFIGFGLPILGSLYTAVLNQFDDSMFDQSMGSTRVVQSTYVDFEQWALRNRLAIPEAATITWANGQADPRAMMNVRTTALAINSSVNPNLGIDVGESGTSVDAVWGEGTAEEGATRVAPTGPGSQVAVAAQASPSLNTFALLQKYMSKEEINGADFESGVKTEITSLNEDVVSKQDKKDWFIGENYSKASALGEASDPSPDEHPVLSVSANTGLQAKTVEETGNKYREFTTTKGAQRQCGFEVVDRDSGNAVACNLAPQAMFNYLNTNFGTDAMTVYSSQKASSGFMREAHMSVTQVGTGPVSMTFWFNAVALLGVMVFVGLAYALGMLFGAFKRMWMVVAAIPFATLGVLGSIAKVLIYTTVLILEILVTLFLYQFISEILLVLPSLLTGPMNSFLGTGMLLGSQILGTVAVVVLTLISTLLIIGIGFGLAKVRSAVMRGLDEQVTKLINRFLETEAAPAGAGQPGGGLGGNLGRGIGAGAAGAALTRGGRNGGGLGGGTNTGGTSGPRPVGGGGGIGGGGTGGGGSSGGGGGGKGGGTGGIGPSGDGAAAAGSQSQLTGRRGGSDADDRKTAAALQKQGGLSKLGYGKGAAAGALGAGAGIGAAAGSELTGGTKGEQGASGGGASANGQDGTASVAGRDGVGAAGEAGYDKTGRDGTGRDGTGHAGADGTAGSTAADGADGQVRAGTGGGVGETTQGVEGGASAAAVSDQPGRFNVAGDNTQNAAERSDGRADAALGTAGVGATAAAATGAAAGGAKAADADAQPQPRAGTGGGGLNEVAAADQRAQQRHEAQVANDGQRDVRGQKTGDAIGGAAGSSAGSTADGSAGRASSGVAGRAEAEAAGTSATTRGGRMAPGVSKESAKTAGQTAGQTARTGATTGAATGARTGAAAGAATGAAGAALGGAVANTARAGSQTQARTGRKATSATRTVATGAAKAATSAAAGTAKAAQATTRASSTGTGRVIGAGLPTPNTGAPTGASAQRQTSNARPANQRSSMGQGSSIPASSSRVQNAKPSAPKFQAPQNLGRSATPQAPVTPRAPQVPRAQAPQQARVPQAPRVQAPRAQAPQAPRVPQAPRTQAPRAQAPQAPRVQQVPRAQAPQAPRVPQAPTVKSAPAPKPAPAPKSAPTVQAPRNGVPTQVPSTGGDVPKKPKPPRFRR